MITISDSARLYMELGDELRELQLLGNAFAPFSGLGAFITEAVDLLAACLGNKWTAPFFFMNTLKERKENLTLSDVAEYAEQYGKAWRAIECTAHFDVSYCTTPRLKFYSVICCFESIARTLKEIEALEAFEHPHPIPEGEQVLIAE